MCLVSCIAVSIGVIGMAGGQGDAGWVSLFDGKTLNGWSVHSGFAKYTVEDGMVVGAAVRGSPNSFLCTDKEFGNFVLEFEVKCDPNLNSGVQFRSHIATEEMAFVFQNAKGEPRTLTIPADRVYGPQVEIATARSRSCGGVYDEARRGFFIGEVRDKEVGGAAFKDNEWNKYRIECQGSSVKTWVNGVACADFKDSMDPKGIIGLQVHGLGKDFKPYQVRWRNIRLKAL
ncbi:MAG: hypothetical protein A2Y77_06140 [Planctomycetes bacterium RBG_13_62_9]|nr:MAG: hypothetical protein A2Y77_06140 [Planctomycetes bacterium RBG_13_62_9]